MDLFSIVGEEAVQSQLRSSRRNYTNYGQISRCMSERGPDRDTLQGRVKVKELRNTYHKVRAANHRSSAAPISCRFYRELDTIVGGDPTSTAKATVDTSVACMPVESGPSQEEDILDEDMEGRKQELKAWRDSEKRDRKENAALQNEAMERLLKVMEHQENTLQALLALQTEQLCALCSHCRKTISHASSPPPTSSNTVNTPPGSSLYPLHSTPAASQSSPADSQYPLHSTPVPLQFSPAEV
ncbi:hypothetical protein UY3_14362 [Chelonia mydas]|uniref:Myb/SANT-like DNA-binding domain-containing protein n=1 Tax=Chelonia mydas TaxID=8469 RepID=M7AT28_CHEMY|nr:hypothetical protein UY3_14362 [Chelonia mydas]